MSHNIETSYIHPKIPELIKEGYYSRYVSYSCTDEIIAYLTSYGCVFNKIANIYLSNNSNSIVYPTRMSITVYAYGLNNIERFGNKLDNCLYQSALVMIRHILNKNNIYIERTKHHVFSINNFMKLADVIERSCKEDAKSLASKVANKDKIYIPEPNSWYNKLLTK